MGEEESETDTEHEDSHQGAAQRPGVVSCRRRARLRQVWASDELFVIRDVSIPPRNTVPCVPWLPENFYQQTLEHFLTFVAKRSLPILEGTHMDTALTIYSSAQHMFEVQHHWRNILMGPFMDTYLRYSRHGAWQATKIPPVSARLEIAHFWSHVKSFHSKRVVINRSKTGIGGSTTARALSSWSCCAVTPGLRNFIRCEHDNWCHQPLRSRIRGPSQFRHEKMDNARKPTSLSPSDGNGPPQWRSCPFCRRGDKEALVLFSYHQFWTEFLKACQSLNLQNVTLYEARHSGPSIDRAMNVQHLNECKSRGQWRTDQSAQQYVENARLAADYFGVASSSTRIGRNLRTTCRGSQPTKALLALASEERQCTLHLFAPCDVVASRIRAYGFPCCSICKDQTSLALQRAYRVNLRRDIKDRRIAGALLTPPRGTDSLSSRCLDTCCFVARQLLIARKPWIRCIIKQQQLLVLSCHPAGHTAEHLGHDYRFVRVW